MTKEIKNMNNKSITLILILAFSLLTACIPQAPVVQDQDQITQQPIEDTETLNTESEITSSNDEQAEPFVSRGDELSATDPSTVDLKSGKPTLLEFFRFT
jgi:hypothetical protein